ncbi:unnamed protein product (macronuclear) [Paramecium tetraurelia]|uniref:Uncharacterized protein n=1 Tax=Paramecium tetraurelia TaxID=5888 RepID=A0EFK7_PARTE|nr:uncharacterized protein GSPATT00026421001 [Paramecium tetraurelia]CAK94098.1 unnamed protein product [Paramecium tetraurelia]|eukprot:XP_001461471.1 hypothetical protein (macronuclear) [Paramecium tetraurelia strain d4-2]
MNSSINISKCSIHNESSIIFDTDQQCPEKKIYCIKCLAQNYQNLIPVENILDFKRELIQMLIQEQKNKNENNIEKLVEIIKTQSDTKNNTIAIVDKNILNLNEQIEAIHRESTLLSDLNVDIQDEESLQKLFYQVQQQSQRALQIKELLNQQLHNLKYFEQAQDYISQKMTEIQFENSQQVKEMNQNFQQLLNRKQKNQSVKCQKHTQEGLMIDLNESSVILGRFACQDCIQDQKISFTKLEEFNIQCKKHLEAKKIELTKFECFTQKTNLAIEKLNDHIARIHQHLSNALSELKGLSDAHLDELSREQSRNTKDLKDLSQSELTELAEEISNKQYLNEYKKKIQQQNETKVRKFQEALNSAYNDQLKLFLDFYQEIYNIQMCNKNQNIERIRQSDRLKICSCTIQLQLYNNKNTQSKILQQSKNISQQIANQQISTIKQEKWCFTISFYRDGSQMVVSSNEQIKVFKNQNGQFSLTQTISQGHTENVQCLKFMNRSQRFISGGKDKLIIVWSLNDKQQYFCEQKLIGHCYGVTCLDFNKDENLLISGSTDDKVRFWTLKNEWEMSETFIQHEDQVQALSLSENQQLLLSCSKETILVHQIIDRENLKCEQIQKISSQFPIYRISLINNRIFVFQSSKSTLQIYLQEKNSQIFTPKDQIQITNTENCYLYSPTIYLSDQGLLMFKSGQNIYLLKRTNDHHFTIQEKIQYQGIETVAAISPDGQYLSAWNKELKEIQIRKLV